MADTQVSEEHIGMIASQIIIIIIITTTSVRTISSMLSLVDKLFN